MTFYARGDSSSANNAALNAQGTNTTPVTELEFEATVGGDIILDYNGGAADPDTIVYVDGVATTFTVEFSGTLPLTNKLKDVDGTDLRGAEITVITTDDGQRYFFLTDGSGTISMMDDFPNGAHAIGNIDTTTNVLICFSSGTLIRIPQGDIAVQNLKIGDKVITVDGQITRIQWIGRRVINAAELRRNPQFRPVNIQTGALGPGLPSTDLTVSQQHRVLISDWRVEFHFALDQMLVAAKHLVDNEFIKIDHTCTKITYFHIMFDAHKVIYSNDLPTESFHPGEMALSALNLATQSEIFTLFPQLQHDTQDFGGIVHPALKAYEAKVLSSQLMPAE